MIPVFDSSMARPSVYCTSALMSVAFIKENFESGTPVELRTDLERLQTCQGPVLRNIPYQVHVTRVCDMSARPTDFVRNSDGTYQGSLSAGHFSVCPGSTVSWSRPWRGVDGQVDRPLKTLTLGLSGVAVLRCRVVWSSDAPPLLPSRLP